MSMAWFLNVNGECLNVVGSTGDRELVERFALTQGGFGAKSKVQCSHLGLRLRGESRAFNDDKGST